MAAATIRTLLKRVPMTRGRTFACDLIWTLSWERLVGMMAVAGEKSFINRKIDNDAPYCGNREPLSSFLTSWEWLRGNLLFRSHMEMRERSTMSNASCRISDTLDDRSELSLLLLSSRYVLWWWTAGKIGGWDAARSYSHEPWYRCDASNPRRLLCG